jgi:heme oxygenase (biliverdin-producing, ferredoxin)
MLKRVEEAGRQLRPASLLEALRERTKALHTQAERSGIIAEILHGRGTRAGYVLLLRNLFPVYATMETELLRHHRSPGLGAIVCPELNRAAAIEFDLGQLSDEWSDLPLLSAARDYAAAISEASVGAGQRLIAHAYARYLGDLSGGQIIKRLLARSLDLPATALSFYEFSAISDIAAFKAGYRAAIERAGDELDDFDGVVEEGARAFELNIELAVALQAAVEQMGLRAI